MASRDMVPLGRVGRRVVCGGGGTRSAPAVSSGVSGLYPTSGTPDARRSPDPSLHTPAYAEVRY
jgi:hypothetical protein